MFPVLPPHFMFLDLIICLQEASINIKKAFCFAEKGNTYVRERWTPKAAVNAVAGHSGGCVAVVYLCIL